jgi:uncharacterized protein (TIGR03790 family)
MNMILKIGLALCLTLLSYSAFAENSSRRISGENVVIVYKNSDNLSKNIAYYYANKRKVPTSQIVGIDLGEQNQINRQKFNTIKRQVNRVLNKDIKVIVLTWNAPYRVECMSITSAFTLGFDTKYCNKQKQLADQAFQCKQTADSPYYNKRSSTLWQNDKLQLTMMLSARTFREAKELINRGVNADNSHPKGSAYLVRTNDANRSTRWPVFKSAAELWPRLKGINLTYLDYSKADQTQNITNKSDVMFYFTGREQVADIETNTYLPGAIADHLTSVGGQGLSQAGQMKVYRWLEAGVTGSYGGVVEPCNYPQKFPNIMVLLPNYLNGDTLIEAYWKSVQQPGEGLFVGEPLAAPWASR